MSFQIPKTSLTNDSGNVIDLSSSINDIAQENKVLSGFMRDPRFARDQGQPDTNIIGRGIGCACFPPDVIQQFLAYVEVARRKGLSPMLAEKQIATGSGIFIDIDIQQETKIMEHQFDHRFYSKLIKQLFNVIIEMFDLHDYPKQIITVGITQKKHVTSKDLGGGVFVNSAGFHILIPGLKITRGAKKHLITELVRLGVIERLIASSGIKTLNAASKYLDSNSAKVVSFFVGCAREKGRPPHELAYVFDVEILDGCDTNVVPNPTIVPTNPAVNIVGEFSLNYETMERMIPKIQVKPTAKHIAAIDKLDHSGIQSGTEDLDEEGELLNEYNLTATRGDPGLRYIEDIMSVISPSRSFKHNDVWPILQTLANMGERYKKTAENFLRRFPEKFGNMANFNRRWTDAMSTANVARLAGLPMRTFKYIEYIARQCDKAKFQAIVDNHEIMNIYNIALDPKTVGKFQHAHIARLLYQMYSEEYVLDYENGAKTPQWFKMMLPGDYDLQPGEMFKWRPYAEPISLSRAISDVLMKKFSAVYNSLVEKQKTLADDPTSSKIYIDFFKGVIKDFKITCGNLMQRPFKQNVIAECKELFMKRGFIEQLDADDMIMGVGNGLLKFGNNGFVEFINHMHEYKVCTSTKVNWKRFNPRNDDTKTMLLCLRSMFSDEDSDKFELVMNYACLGLTGKQKPSKMFMLYGGGRNGKSMFMEWLRNVYGDYGGKGSSSLIAGATSSSADNASPAMYAIKGKRFMSYGECGPNSNLNVQFFKEILGGEKQTARPLYGQLSSFYAKCIHFLPLNNLLKIHNTDYATWRRVVLIKHTIKFFNRASPDYDPRNPNHRIQDKYIRDPSTLAQNPIYQEAMLSFLVYTWEQLQYKYDGDLDKIPHPHVKADTALYKSTQDTFDDFINRRFVKLADTNARFDMNKIITCYIQWMETKGHGKGVRGDDLEDKLRDSKISDFIKSDRIGSYMLGHKFLLPTEELPPGATYMFEVGAAKPANVEEKEKEEAFTKGNVALGGDKQIKKALEEAQEEMKQIKPETPEQFYERICEEYDRHEERRTRLSNIPSELKDPEMDEITRKIEVAEHEIMVKNIRKECAERQAQQEQQQAERFREMMAQAQAITTININPNQEIPTRDTDNSHGITPDSDGLLF